MVKGNLMVGQSGGPTAVINSSLAGVFKTAKDRGVKTVYGMLNGIQGLLKGSYVDLSEHIQSMLDIELLKRTPSSFLGSCRYKLPKVGENDEIFKQIFTILDKLDVKYFLYIGGNDSMDTIHKLDTYAKKVKSDIKFMGVPKTIDNDLPITDHTPGFGSAAKFVGTVTKELVRDSLVYGNPMVTVVEIMGRNAGWLTAAASLARCEDCEGPDLIYLPEVVFDVDKFVSRVEELLKKKRSLLIAVSEGLKLKDGTYVCELNDTVKTIDAFGHTALGGTAFKLADIVARKTGCKTRPVMLSSLQRCASHMVSRVDITEAFQVGGQGVKSALEGESGKVVVLIRKTSDPYQVTTDVVDVDKVANIEKKVPLEWITNDGSDISKKLTDYIRPLIQAELTPIMVDGLPSHLLLKGIKHD